MEDNRKAKIAINLMELVRLVKQDKKGMAVTFAIAAVVGLVVAFSIPKTYTAGVMLAPESSNASTLGGSISSLASMVGMDLNVGGGADAIYPEIYPDLMKSNDFLVTLFPVPVTTKDGKLHCTYYEYIQQHQKTPFWEVPMGMLASLMSKFSASDDMSAGNGKGKGIDPFRLTRQQYGVIKALNGNITCAVDKKTSVISIQVKDQDPLIAATMADSVKSRLQVFITNYRTNKARNDLAYMERLFREAHDQYVKVRREYAHFSDTNTDVILESVRSEQEDLENEMQLKYNIYTQVAEQLQLARAKVQERTPAFTVIQSASVPIKATSRSRSTMLLMFLFLGFMVRVAMLFYKNRRLLVRIAS